MKTCPKCQRTYSDESLKFCRDDGTQLLAAVLDEAPTQRISSTLATTAVQTQVLEPARERVTAETRPATRYAKSGDVNVAYQVLGEGPVDLVYVPGWVTHIEYGWEQPLVARFFRRLASFSRLILFDKRGTGLSDQTSDLPTLEQRMDDVRAVMEAVGSERAAVFGMSEGGNMAMLFAATYPERTLALITFGVFAKRVYDREYPWAPKPEERQKFYDAIENEWGGPLGIEDLAPSLAHDLRFREWWATYQRRSASPRAALALARMNTLIDVRDVLPAIRVPTLVMHRIGDRDSNIEEGRYIAARIPDAEFVELGGDDHMLYAGDQDGIIERVKEFLARHDRGQNTDTVLATVLCVRHGAPQTDSSARLPERLRAIARREAEWFKGRVADDSCNGFVAIFDGPARAIRCAYAIRHATEEFAKPIKAAVHTGLCEVGGNKIGGVAVDVARQLAACAEAGEIVVSNSTRDLVSGSRLEFRQKSEPLPEGIAGISQLFSVEGGSGQL